MSTYNGGSAGFWPLKRIVETSPDSPVVWDTETEIVESQGSGWCGTIPYGHGSNIPEVGRLKFGTYKDFIEWQEGGKK